MAVRSAILATAWFLVIKRSSTPKSDISDHILNAWNSRDREFVLSIKRAMLLDDRSFAVSQQRGIVLQRSAIYR